MAGDVSFPKLGALISNYSLLDAPDLLNNEGSTTGIRMSERARRSGSIGSSRIDSVDARSDTAEEPGIAAQAGIALNRRNAFQLPRRSAPANAGTAPAQTPPRRSSAHCFSAAPPLLAASMNDWLRSVVHSPARIFLSCSS